MTVLLHDHLQGLRVLDAELLLGAKARLTVGGGEGDVGVRLVGKETGTYGWSIAFNANLNNEINANVNVNVLPISEIFI